GINFLESTVIPQLAIEQKRQLGHVGDRLGIVACNSGPKRNQEICKASAGRSRWLCLTRNAPGSDNNKRRDQVIKMTLIDMG
ncbi:MAG TPA: hypothetical protein VHV54_17825, partial [Candidatus Binatia bacterium]|nr:hypothetical protein [Candidatus Binatia bacterium]